MIPNEGVLAKDMVATATTIVNGDTVYPYEPLSCNITGWEI